MHSCNQENSIAINSILGIIIRILQGAEERFSDCTTSCFCLYVRILWK